MFSNGLMTIFSQPKFSRHSAYNMWSVKVCPKTSFSGAILIPGFNVFIISSSAAYNKSLHDRETLKVFLNPDDILD